MKKGRKLRGEKGVEEWERHIVERKDTAPGIEREKCLRERDIFRHGGKIQTLGIGKRPEKSPVWWEISLRGRENVVQVMEPLVLRFCISVGGKSVEKDLNE